MGARAMSHETAKPSRKLKPKTAKLSHKTARLSPKHVDKIEKVWDNVLWPIIVTVTVFLGIGFVLHALGLPA